MPLPPSFLDELRARTPLPPLVGRKVRLARNGRQWKGCCPFHQEKTPSFHVFDDHYHCFGCGAHGDAFAYLMRTEGMGFREAVERLAAEAGLEVPRESPREAARQARARDLHGVLEAAAEAMRRRLRGPEGRRGLDYLRGRGLSEETIEAAGLGWSGPGRGALAADLVPLGVSADQLVEAGLAKRAEGREGLSDFYFDRVMFPIRDARGRVVSFGGRVLGEGVPKYLNGPETAVFSKRRTLYGLDRAREAVFRGDSPLLVAEGYLDVLALHQAGFGGAVAPLGTALTEDQLEALWRLSPEPVLCLDGDAAGARAAARTIELALPRLAPGRALRLAALPPGEDPDTLLRRGGRPAFEAVLAAAKPLSAALYDLLAEGASLATPEDRAALRHRLEEAAGRVGDRALASELRRGFLDRYFEARSASRGGGRTRPRPSPARPPIREASARAERARCLLAITLAHPWVLGEVEEAFALVELPTGPAEALRSALLARHAGAAASLDSRVLPDHLGATGLGEARDWAAGGAAPPAAARREAQPAEVLEGWWHFFGLLRGEGGLLEDLRAASDDLQRKNDASSQSRVTRLRETLLALRRGEAGLEEEAASGGAA